MTTNWISKAIEALEWKRFLALTEAGAKTELGKKLINSLEDPENWATNVAHAKIMQQETQEVLLLLGKDALWGPITDLADSVDILERLARGAVLEVQELCLLRMWLYAIDSWTQTPRDELPGELFKKAVNSLPDPFECLRILDKILTPVGELSEKASPRLAQLYQEIRALKREIGAVLDNLLKTFAQKGYLQDQFSDVRDGKFVIPVRTSAQGEVEGNIYEASSSGQTVFIEPKEIAGLNNRLRQRSNDLVQEIFVILSETSKRMQPYASEIQGAVSVIAHWDVVHAKALRGQNYSGKSIQVTEERKFSLDQTAHPLLWHSLQPESIVRNRLDFGAPVKTLLITGPNTGGKTVLLKTLGLAGICARTGFPFPAINHPVVPFFDSFFADLGDPQSIEEHLSSFSGHILRFKETIENMTDQSLILIDELNGATDPEEGAALGRAYLETVMSRGAMVVSTTHDPRLKAVAISDTRILNASMAFDEVGRVPTFQLLLGIPGRSRAFETAERLGFSREVLELAKQYLTKEHVAFETLLAGLEKEVHTAAEARKEAVTLKNEALALKKEWTERTETTVNDMFDRVRQKLKRIMEQAQEEVRQSVKKLDEMKNRKEADKTRTTLNETMNLSLSRLESTLREEAPEVARTLSSLELEKKALKKVSHASSPQFEVGAQVRIPKWKSLGSILEIQGAKVKVAMGSIQMSLSITDIEPLSAEELARLPAQQNKSTKSIQTGTPPAPPPVQLDLRGVRLEDAMSELGGYLDLAFRSGAYAEVTIVHGMGTGAIREGTRKLLKSLPYIKSFRDGGAGGGGTGATIVEFERD